MFNVMTSVAFLILWINSLLKLCVVCWFMILLSALCALLL